MPEEMRKEINEKKQEEQEIRDRSVPLLKFPRNKNTEELTETANGVEIPQSDQPYSTFYFFRCSECGVEYNDTQKHAKTCKGKTLKELTFQCPHCKEIVPIVSHICKAEIVWEKISRELEVEDDWEDDGFKFCGCGKVINQNADYCSHCSKIGTKFLKGKFCECGHPLTEEYLKAYHNPLKLCTHCRVRELTGVKRYNSEGRLIEYGHRKK